MTWQEVLDSNVKTVTVESYGYVERNIFGSHFEPFAHKRQFKFTVNKSYKTLENSWLYLDEPEEDLFFEKRNGEIFVEDPELWARELSTLETLKSVLMRLGRNTIFMIVYTENK